MSNSHPSREKRRSERRNRDRHPPTFRDRPIEVLVNVVILALIGGLIAYGCTALLLN